MLFILLTFPIYNELSISQFHFHLSKQSIHINSFPKALSNNVISILFIRNL